MGGKINKKPCPLKKNNLYLQSMNIKDLRVGNLIADHECEPYYFAVEEIKKNEQGNLAVYYRNGSCMTAEPEPIKLTLEWYAKFEHPYIETEYNHGGIDYELAPDDEVKFFLYDCDGGKIGKEIKYVHELQNLYFALTGTELKPKA